MVQRMFYVAIPVEVRHDHADLKHELALHLDGIISRSEQSDTEDDHYRMLSDVTVYTLEDLLADYEDGTIQQCCANCGHQLKDHSGVGGVCYQDSGPGEQDQCNCPRYDEPIASPAHA